MVRRRPVSQGLWFVVGGHVTVWIGSTVVVSAPNFCIDGEDFSSRTPFKGATSPLKIFPLIWLRLHCLACAGVSMGLCPGDGLRASCWGCLCGWTVSGTFLISQPPVQHLEHGLRRPCDPNGSLTTSTFPPNMVVL